MKADTVGEFILREFGIIIGVIVGLLFWQVTPNVGHLPNAAQTKPFINVSDTQPLTIAEIREKKYGPTVGGRIWDQCKYEESDCNYYAKRSMVAYIQLEEVLEALGNITRELAYIKSDLNAIKFASEMQCTAGVKNLQP